MPMTGKPQPAFWLVGADIAPDGRCVIQSQRAAVDGFDHVPFVSVLGPDPGSQMRAHALARPGQKRLSESSPTPTEGSGIPTANWQTRLAAPALDQTHRFGERRIGL